MAITALTPVQVDRSGSIATPNTSSSGTVMGAGAGNGITVSQAPGLMLRVVWTAVDSVTVAIPGGGPDGTPASKIISLGAGASSGDCLLGPFPQSIYGSTISAYSGAATTKVSAIQLVPAYN